MFIETKSLDVELNYIESYLYLSLYNKKNLK